MKWSLKIFYSICLLRLFYIRGWPQIDCVDQVDLEFTVILLPLLPKQGNYRYMPPHLAHSLPILPP